MFEIHKNYVLDENQQPIAVQIPIAEFEQIEEILENYGLVKLMEELEGEDSEHLSHEEALKYYQSLKQQNGITADKKAKILTCERIARRREIYKTFP